MPVKLDMDDKLAFEILEAEQSTSDLQSLLSSLKLDEGDEFSPMSALMFTQLGASSPYYVPLLLGDQVSTTDIGAALIVLITCTTDQPKQPGRLALQSQHP